jgi:hypothetical protein
MRVRESHQSLVAGELVYMLAGITAAENAHLQRHANVLERQLMEQRFKDPAATAANLRSALRKAGLVRVRLRRLASSWLWFDAELGPRLKLRLREVPTRSDDDIGYDCVRRAARRIGLEPGIEDIYSKVEGQKLEGAVAMVPFAVMSAALDRMLDRWREQRASASALNGVRRKQRK